MNSFQRVTIDASETPEPATAVPDDQPNIEAGHGYDALLYDANVFEGHHSSTNLQGLEQQDAVFNADLDFFASLFNGPHGTQPGNFSDSLNILLPSPNIGMHKSSEGTSPDSQNIQIDPAFGGNFNLNDGFMSYRNVAHNFRDSSRDIAYSQIFEDQGYAANDIGGSIDATTSFIRSMNATQMTPLISDKQTLGFQTYDYHQELQNDPGFLSSVPVAQTQNQGAETVSIMHSGTLTPDTAEILRYAGSASAQSGQFSEQSHSSLLTLDMMNFSPVLSHAAQSADNNGTFKQLDPLPQISNTSQVAANVPIKPRLERGKTKGKASSNDGIRALKRSKNTASFEKAIGMFSATNTPARKSYNLARRQEVARTRALGACFACRMWKATCRQSNGSEEPCERCAARFTESDVSRTQLCFRIDLDDLSIFRKSSALHSEEVRPSMEWVTKGIITLQVNFTTHDRSQPIDIQCRHFKPRDTDVVVKYGSFSDPIPVPTYASSSLPELARDLVNIAKGLRDVYIQEKADKGCSEAVIKSLHAASRYASQHPTSLVNAALDIWVGSKMCQVEKTLVGEEALGMQPVTDPKSLLYNMIPVPPKLDHQIDTLLIEWMSETGTRLMKAFSKRVLDKNREGWYEMFLTIFVMLNEVEYVYGQQKEYCAEFLDDEIYLPKIRKVSEMFAQQWKLTAEHILHVYRTYFRKRYPFSRFATDRMALDKSLDDCDRSYLHRMMDLQDSIVAERKDPIEIQDFDYEMVWGSHLFQKL